MEVEDAILELLQPLRETPGAKTVAAFQGQPDKDTWARLRRGFPAVLVLYAGSPAFMPSGRRLEERMEFEVYVMDKSYRSAANGQKPEPLAALQYLTSRIVSRRMEAPVRVQFDVGDYRERQDDRLRELALALAERVRATGRPCSTRPMSSYHRRLVHMALQDSPDVQTRSSGEGPLKRVIIQRRRQERH